MIRTVFSVISVPKVLFDFEALNRSAYLVTLLNGNLSKIVKYSENLRVIIAILFQSNFYKIHVNKKEIAFSALNKAFFQNFLVFN